MIHNKITGCLLFLAVLCVTGSLHATPDTSGKLSQTSITLFDRILQGGFAMIPLGLCSLFLFFLIFYSWKETQHRKFVPNLELSEVLLRIRESAFDEARLLFNKSDSVLGRSMSTILAKLKPGPNLQHKDKIESWLSESLEAEENNISQWINYLNVIASVAPMIGLLGTVSGMISAFDTMAAGGMGRPELLAGNIGEALITTATGLVIGIPAMIAYFIMRNRLNNAMVRTIQTASQLVDEVLCE